VKSDLKPETLWLDGLTIAIGLSLLWLTTSKEVTPWGFVLDGIQQVQFTHYGHHQFYKTHEDVFQLENNMRKVSAVLQLCDPKTYKGGELLLMDTRSEEFAAEPKFRKQGSIIVFPSLLMHQVTPVTKGDRYSAVAWATGPQLR